MAHATDDTLYTVKLYILWTFYFNINPENL